MFSKITKGLSKYQLGLSEGSGVKGTYSLCILTHVWFLVPGQQAQRSLALQLNGSGYFWPLWASTPAHIHFILTVFMSMSPVAPISLISTSFTTCTTCSISSIWHMWSTTSSLNPSFSWLFRCLPHYLASTLPTFLWAGKSHLFFISFSIFYLHNSFYFSINLTTLNATDVNDFPNKIFKSDSVQTYRLKS